MILSLLFAAAGVNHFVNDDLYLAIMPQYLPQPELLVYLSGCFEVAGGVGLLLPRLRRAAGWGLILLLVAVFPANVHMALNADTFDDFPFWLLIARLPMQVVLITWVYWTAIHNQSRSAS